MSISSPYDLERVINCALNDVKPTGQNENFAFDIGTYKWYNYYQNLHIAKGSAEDKENEMLFEQLEKRCPVLHKEVEAVIDYYIAKLELDID